MMTQTEILHEFERLPLKQQLEVIASAIRILQQRVPDSAQSVGPATPKLPLEEAAALLHSDYAEDEELTAFTVLDGEDSVF